MTWTILVLVLGVALYMFGGMMLKHDAKKPAMGAKLVKKAIKVIAIITPMCQVLCWAMLGPKKTLVTQSCPTLGNRMDCSLPGSSVHGILQARILER